jgi:hypothetical protein
VTNGRKGTAPQVPARRLIKSTNFVDECIKHPDSMIYFLLNVADGDTQLILLPCEDDRTRRAVVVDVATTRKLPALLDSLAETPILPERRTNDLFAVVVGTHPHDDHIGGMPEFMERFADMVSEYWEPGYYHPTAAFVETMHILERNPKIQRTQPTSGMTRFIDKVKLTALAPGIGLRSRFDSYGTAINDASIAVKIEFPIARVVQKGKNRGYLRVRDPWSLILGADAQTTSWGHVSLDFPQLHAAERSSVYKELRKAMGVDALRAQVFKVPHHASKHGVNLELVERIAPNLALISSTGGRGKYNFPHLLAVEAVREGMQPSTGGGKKRLADYELGIHYTSAVDSGRSPLGSMALIVPPKRGSPLQLWRFGDEPGEPVRLETAREFDLHPARRRRKEKARKPTSR